MRQALDRLLVLYPGFDVVSIDWQLGIEEDEQWGARAHVGVWVIVRLGQPSETFEETPAWAIWPFAIFKRTGAIHTFPDADGQSLGAVSDDPIWTPTMNDAP